MRLLSIYIAGIRSAYHCTGLCQIQEHCIHTDMPETWVCLFHRNPTIFNTIVWLCANAQRNVYIKSIPHSHLVTACISLLLEACWRWVFRQLLRLFSRDIFRKSKGRLTLGFQKFLLNIFTFCIFTWREQPLKTIKVVHGHSKGPHYYHNTPCSAVCWGGCNDYRHLNSDIRIASDTGSPSQRRKQNIHIYRDAASQRGFNLGSENTYHETSRRWGQTPDFWQSSYFTRLQTKTLTFPRDVESPSCMWPDKIYSCTF